MQVVGTHLRLRESCWSFDLSRSATEKLALPRKLLCRRQTGGEKGLSTKPQNIQSVLCKYNLLYKYPKKHMAYANCALCLAIEKQLFTDISESAADFNTTCSPRSRMKAWALNMWASFCFPLTSGVYRRHSPALLNYCSMGSEHFRKACHVQLHGRASCQLIIWMGANMKMEKRRLARV